MRTQSEIRKLAAEKYKEGMAVYDLKFNEVFSFSFQTDAQVVVEWPDMFRPASEEEERILKESGNSFVVLDQ